MSASPALKPVKKISVVDGVIDRLRDLLRSGLPGAKLPGERELAKRLGVSRPTVREALGTLERMGVLDTRQDPSRLSPGPRQAVHRRPP